MDEHECIQRCVNGDQQARTEFFTQYSRLIYSYMLHVLKSYGAAATPEQEREDMFQELITSIYNDNCRKLAAFSGRNGCTLAGWLRAVVVNSTIDLLRRRRAPSVSLEEEVNEEFSLKDTLVDQQALPSESASARELENALTECIQALGLQAQYFLELHYHQRVTLEELAVHYRTTRASMDMRKSRLLSRLRECFKKKGVEFPTDGPYGG